MVVDLTAYNVKFRAPVLPDPPKEYDQASLIRFNNILRIYFNQVDDALRNPNLKEQSDATSWFLG